jgi:hypothetical protein
MRFRCCLHCAGTGGFLAAVAWLLSSGIWAACPDTQKYECLCLQPPTTVDCTTIGSPGTCVKTKGQVKEKNYWDCKSGSSTECLNGTDEAVCYTEADCYWDTNKGACQLDTDTGVQHRAVLKINEDCEPQS